MTDSSLLHMSDHDETKILGEIIRLRRTLKPVDMDPSQSIEREKLNNIFEAANWAPNHGSTEPWRFNVYESKESREDLAQSLQKIYDQVTPPQNIQPEKRGKLGTLPLFSPIVATIIRNTGSNPKIPEIEETEAVACAVQNATLLASTYGIGSFWSSPPLLYLQEMNQWLNLKEQDACLGLLYLGYPKEGKSATGPGKRSPISDKINWH